MIHDTQSTQISQKQDEHNLYAIMKTICPPGYHLCGNSCTSLHDARYTTFKERYRNHKKESNDSKYQNSTELSKYIWKLKRDKIDFTIKWSIVERVNRNVNSTRCNLCLTEKLY